MLSWKEMTILNETDFLLTKNLSKQSFGKISRLAYTKKFYRLLFFGEEKDFEQKIINFSWQSIYKKNFLLRIHNNKKFDEAKLAGIIWKSLKYPKVEVHNPETKIVAVFFGKQFFCMQELWKNTQKFQSRKPHNRPEQHPSSLDPRLARCMVNLADSKNIVDPFCGAGGILIESALMGLNTKGSDFDKVMVNRARINLEFFGIKTVQIEQKDALKVNLGKSFAIVTDFPYGKNTKVDNLEGLLYKFLKKTACKRIVIGLNDQIPYKKIIKKTRWRIKKEFSVYIHKSMTKKILVLELNK